MIELRDVSYRYAGYARLVLRDVSLRIADGEMVGVVGANEAGKSSLCLVASGLAPAAIGGAITTGSVEVDGETLAGVPLHRLAERVAIGFQDPRTQLSGSTGSVVEEVALGPLNLGLTGGTALARAHHALEALGMTELAERDPGRLSGGQGQLVVIASLLAMRPRHLVLDEPTAQLDPHGTRLVAEALRGLAASGTALLVVEHRTDVLEALCERILVLDGGSIVREGWTADVLDDERLLGWGVAPPTRVSIDRALAGASGAT
jgi:energy-coupling factor transporter ATP-binding protein EcfA2